MNNNYFFSALCLTILAFAPACKKEQPAAPKKDEIKTTIELDSVIFETENKTTIVKF